MFEIESFVEEVFPDDVSYGASGGPEFSTRVTQARNGAEFRNVEWEHPRCRFTVAHAVKTKEQLEELVAFFRARKGRAVGFRFKDWSDFEGKNQLIGIGDAVGKNFQLVKFYGNLVGYEKRIINKPMIGSVKIRLDDQNYENFSVNYSTGMVQFAEPPAENVQIRADFEFHVPVRFDVDWLSASETSFGKFGWNDIQLLEVKP